MLPAPLRTARSMESVKACSGSPTRPLLGILPLVHACLSRLPWAVLPLLRPPPVKMPFSVSLRKYHDAQSGDSLGPPQVAENPPEGRVSGVGRRSRSGSRCQCPPLASEMRCRRTAFPTMSPGRTLAENSVRIAPSMSRNRAAESGEALAKVRPPG